MKKFITLFAIVLCATAFSASAAKGKKDKTPSAEQTALLAKYDTNKDGKLEADEIAKASEEDKTKIAAAFPAKKKKKK